MHNEIWNFLDHIDGYIIRMISGILRFVLIKLPRWSLDLISASMPTLLKLLRVIILGLVCVVLMFGPLRFIWQFDSPWWLELLGYFWTIIALIGSVWGIFWMRRRRKLFESIKVAIFAPDGEAELEDK